MQLATPTNAPWHWPVATAPFHLIWPPKNGLHLQALPGCMLEFLMVHGAPARPASNTTCLKGRTEGAVQYIYYIYIYISIKRARDDVIMRPVSVLTDALALQ